MLADVVAKALIAPRVADGSSGDALRCSKGEGRQSQCRRGGVLKDAVVSVVSTDEDASDKLPRSISGCAEWCGTVYSAGSLKPV
ncbi:hypothetical protein PI125_g7507 [Phytophthora idaei]|nr:hypothetical protein PI125_g7507 [Phytophthora idaei]KAG3160309.1 hypothetical protein PI126_g6963 [Phytophthora idaei]